MVVVAEKATISATKLKYPKSVAFIISNEFCERFNFYGLRAILVLYLTRKLLYTDDEATVLFHAFTGLVYFFPLLGAIIADTWLGRFSTILYLSIVYAMGNVIIAIGAVPNIPLKPDLATMVGLLLISLGTGGIKPCVSAFGGDQFKLPEQTKHLAMFFSLFYMAINAGSLISTTLTPILREDVNCFGENGCYSLAFGVPAALMVCSIIVYIMGKPFYIIKQPSGNMLLNVSKCIGNALQTRSRERHSNPRYHWLDYAEPKFGKTLVYDVKCLLKVLVLYIPLPIFWALFDQQGSRWTFQATRMNSNVGFISIKPDQMQVINPLIVVFCIPLFNLWIYPLLARLHIKTALQKLTLGMVLCGIAFVMSGALELQVEKSYPVLPKLHEGQLRIYNGHPCSFNIQTSIPHYDSITVMPMGLWEEKHIKFSTNSSLRFVYNATSTDAGCPAELTGVFEVHAGKAQSYFINGNGVFESFEDHPDKPQKGYPLLRVLSTEAPTKNASILLKGENQEKQEFRHLKLDEIQPGPYTIQVDGKAIQSIELKQGGTYTVLVSPSTNDSYAIKLLTIAPPNTINILWQIPQYLVITAGEILFSVTGLEFSFTQAPSSMKSVLQALWLLTVTFGNIIVVVIAETKLFESQASEFFLFALLMAIDILLFAYLACKYTYRDESNSETDIEINTKETKNIPSISFTAGLNGRRSSDKECLDAKPKCLKQRSAEKNGIENPAYSE